MARRATYWLGLRGAGARWAFATVFVVAVFGDCGCLRKIEVAYQLGEPQAQQAEVRQQEEHLSKQLDQVQAGAIQGTPLSTRAAGTQLQPHPFPIVASALVPGLVRSSAQQQTLIIPPGPHLVHLQLDLESKRPVPTACTPS